jgi:hypothetical protein
MLDVAGTVNSLWFISPMHSAGSYAYSNAGYYYNSINRDGITAGTITGGGAYPWIIRSGNGTYNDGYITMETGGAERLRLNASGNLGIGTSTPGGMLTVYGGNVGIGSTSPQSRLVVFGSGTTSATNAFMVRDSAATFRMVIQDGGNMGLGSSAPQQVLDVVGSAIFSTNVGIGTTAVGARLIVYGGNVGIASTAPGAGLDVSQTSLKIPASTAPTVSAAGHIGIDTTDDQLKYYGAATRVISYERTRCAVFFDLTATDDDMPMGSVVDNYKLQSLWCHCKGTCTTAATIQLETSAASPALIGSAATCAVNTSTPTAQDVSGDADGTLNARVPFQFDVTNTPAPTTDEYVICVSYIVQEQ